MGNTLSVKSLQLVSVETSLIFECIATSSSSSNFKQIYTRVPVTMTGMTGRVAPEYASGHPRNGFTRQTVLERCSHSKDIMSKPFLLQSCLPDHAEDKFRIELFPINSEGNYL
jgi:hypothetical protein